MATREKNEHKNGAAPVEPSAPKDDGWVRLQTDRPVYTADRGRGETVQGYVLGILDMPPVKGRAWRAFIVRLTAGPLKTQKNKQLYLAQVGEEVLVPGNHKLLQALTRAAMHPRVAFEVRIKPAGQTQTTEGSVNNFEVDVNPQPIARDAHARLLAMGSPPAPALDAAPVAEADIPF